MEKVYVFGHKKPDTDSVCSSISAAYLMNQRSKEYNCVPYMLGHINPETKFVLDYFKVKEPSYLNDVKIKIMNVNYRKGLYVNEMATLKEVYKTMSKENMSSVPVVDDKLQLKGLIDLKDITETFMEDEFNIKASFDKIAEVLEAEVINKNDDIVEGFYEAIGYRSSTFTNEKKDLSNTILIVGDRYSVIKHAIKCGVKMLILTDGVYLEPHLKKSIQDNNINAISTSKDAAFVIHTMKSVSYISNFLTKQDIKTVMDSDYYDSFKELASSYGYSSYPVLNRQGEVLGLINLKDAFKQYKKKVILVDHNERAQSATGIEDAEIVEVIDHHKLGNIETNKPINFRNMAVGCTCTILYLMYNEYKVEIPDYIKGLMMSAILSDTLLLRSPTTTKLDENIVKKLAKDLDIDYEKYGIEMFEAGASIKGLEAEDIVLRDYKRFSVEDKWIGVGQIFVTSLDDINNMKPKILDALNSIKKNNEFVSILLFVTSVLDNDSYIYYSEGSEKLVQDAFNLSDIYQGVKAIGVVSRKKQIVPPLMEALK